MTKHSTREANLIVNYTLFVVLINFGIEYFILLFDSRNFIIPFQTGLNILFLILTLSRTSRFKTTPFTGIIMFITLYSLIVCFFSSSFIDSLNLTLKFVTPLFFLIIGYHFLRSYDQLQRFIKTMSITLLFFTLTFIYYNAYGIGESLYEGGVITGYMNINAYYLICYVWIAVLFFDQKKKIYQTIILMLVAIITLIILKRTIILLILISLLLYIRKKMSFKKFFSLALILSFGFLIFNLYFSSFFNASLESRESRFEDDYSIENESRFQENILPFLYIQDQYALYLFGTGEPYNDPAYHIKYLKVDRQLHNSFVRLFWNGGALLLFSFLYLVYKQIKILYKHRVEMKRSSNRFFYHVIYFVIIFIVLRFISEFSSGITYISYNMFSYLIIGGLIGILDRNKLIQKKKVKNTHNKHY